MKKLFIIAFLFSLGSSLLAQEIPKKQTKKQQRKQEKQKKATEMTRQEEEGVLVYSSQSIWGIQLRTNGYGAFYERGKKKSPRNGFVYGIEFNEIKILKKINCQMVPGFFIWQSVCIWQDQ